MNKVLEAQVKNKSIFHAYIFEGQEEDVRKIYSDFIELIYQEEDTRSKDMGLDRFFDVEIIKPENNIITIDRIREMKKKVFELPIEADYKIFVIENAETLRVEAQNALLKTLEEAPDYCIIILTTDNRNKLYDTIISRCQVISDYSEADLELTEEERDSLLDLYQKAVKKEYYSVIASRQFFDKYQDKKKLILNQSIRFFYDLILYNTGQKAGFSVRYSKRLSAFESLNLSKLEQIIFELEKINELLKVNINFQLAMEHVLFTLMEE